MKSNGTAQELVNTVLGSGVQSSADAQNMAEFENSILQGFTQAFMTNIGVSIATSNPTTGVTSDNTNEALSALSQQNPNLSSTTAGAQAFRIQILVPLTIPLSLPL